MRNRNKKGGQSVKKGVFTRVIICILLIAMITSVCSILVAAETRTKRKSNIPGLHKTTLENTQTIIEKLNKAYPDKKGFWKEGIK